MQLRQLGEQGHSNESEKFGQSVGASPLIFQKQRVFVDLDGVVIDSEAAILKSKETGLRVPLEECPPISGAVDALHKLAKKYEVYILSTARWSDPDNWVIVFVYFTSKFLTHLLG